MNWDDSSGKALVYTLMIYFIIAMKFRGNKMLTDSILAQHHKLTSKTYLIFLLIFFTKSLKYRAEIKSNSFNEIFYQILKTAFELCRFSWTSAALPWRRILWTSLISNFFRVCFSHRLLMINLHWFRRLFFARMSKTDVDSWYVISQNFF